jgi:uncharacterized protein
VTFVFVDTSAWYALANRDDPDGKAVKGALSGRGVRALTSTYVFDEAVTLMLKRQGHKPAVTLGDALRSEAVELVPVDETDLEAAWELFRSRGDKGYSFTDCTSFALMRRLGLDTAIALDEDFAKEGFKVKP